MSKEKLRNTDFLNSAEASIGIARLDTDAFERDNQTDLESAFNTFKGNRDGCMCHMMLTMRPWGDFEWRLRKHPPFLLQCVEDAVALDRREASGHWYHGRRIVLHTINGRQVKFKYPHPPTEDEQAELLKLPAIACSCCLPHEMQRGECHAVWLVDKLRKKFQWPHAPELISAAIPHDMIAQAKIDGNWKHARAIHRHAFVARQAVHVSHRRGGTLVPRLIEGITIGNSRFGNPFASLPVAQSRALFEHYVSNNFQELSDATVQAIVSQVDSAAPTGR